MPKKTRLTTLSYLIKNKLLTLFLFILVITAPFALVALSEEVRNFVSANFLAEQKYDTTSLKTAATTFEQKALVLIFDPMLDNGMTVSEYLASTGERLPYDQQIEEGIDFFIAASRNRLQYEVVETIELNHFPVKEDGFQYDSESYFAVINQQTPPHMPDIADYYAFLNDPALDICGKFNRGEIDELWLFGGPWFGFYESAMASYPGGPGFWVNGPTLHETACEGLLPIGIPGAHTFGHRMESTMTYVYGIWEQNSMAHNWNRFGLEGAHSPDFNRFGCGSVHYAPNATTPDHDYDFGLTNYVYSYCHDFSNYPNLSNPGSVARLINCEEWGCTTAGYEMWWWQNLPHFIGRGPDTKLNDWWQYLVLPSSALPTNGVFSNLSAQMPENGPATFRFNYSGEGGEYKIHVSTFPDMSEDVFVNFAYGKVNPIIKMDPRIWDKYSCGRTLYWRITSGSGVESPIIATQVCDQVPTPTPSSAQRCSSQGGNWREFSDGCADSCEKARDPYGIMCTQAITLGCDCGPDKCWDGQQCAQNPSIEIIITPKPKRK